MHSSIKIKLITNKALQNFKKSKFSEITKHKSRIHPSISKSMST